MAKDAIVSNLSDNNYSQTQINDAINQADIKSTIAGGYPYSEQSNMRRLESLAPAPSSSDLEPSYMPDEEPAYMQPEYQTEMIPSQQPAYQDEHVEELVESVVNEKWDELTEKIGNLATWKETTKNEIESIKQEVLRFEQRLENLQKAVLGKINDYDKGIQAIGTDIKALEQVLQKILGPLTTNVKELSKIADKVREKKQAINRKPLPRKKK